MPPELLKIFSQLTYLKPYRGRLFTASISVTHTRSPHTPTHTHHTHTPPHTHPPSLSTLPHARRVYPSTYTQNARPPCALARPNPSQLPFRSLTRRNTVHPVGKHITSRQCSLSLLLSIFPSFSHSLPYSPSVFLCLFPLSQ